MNKFTLLLVLVLPGCVSPEQFAEERAAKLSHAEGVCQRRGFEPGSQDYLKCLQDVGNRYGYKLASDGQLAFVVPPPNGGKGPIGGGTFYPGVYVPPVYNHP